jgi:hypothetical protein
MYAHYGELLGENLDVREFLFGAERSALSAVRPVLMELQRGRRIRLEAPIRIPAD